MTNINESDDILEITGIHKLIHDLLLISGAITIGEFWIKFHNHTELKNVSDRQSISPRFTELKNMGAIKQFGKRRCAATNHRANVWEANSGTKFIRKRNRRTWTLLIRSQDTQAIAYQNYDLAAESASRLTDVELVLVKEE